MKTIRAAVIGTGWGQMHIDALRRVKNVELVALCDNNAARGQEVAKNAKVAKFFRDYDEVLAQDEIDLVSIATPPATQKEIALKSIFAKKHVLCETPLGLNAREAQGLLEAAQARGLVHAVAYQTRYLPSYAFAKELIEEDYLGTFLRASVNMTLERPWGTNGNWAADETRGGGILADVAIHFIDALRWWFGPIESVMADCHTLFPEIRVAVPADKGEKEAKYEKWRATADDAFLALLRFSGGGRAILNFVSGARHEAGWTIALYGSRGSLLITNGALSGRREGERDFGQMEIPRRLELPDRPREPLMWSLQRLIEAMVAQISADKSSREKIPNPPPSFRDGAHNLKIVDAIKRSSDDMMWVAV